MTALSPCDKSNIVSLTISVSAVTLAGVVFLLEVNVLKFCEDEKDIITIPKYQNCFIYFLIDDGEVVYVGQTKNGIIRPLSHRDKVYDEIKIKYCAEKDLDLTEDRYIQFYKPIYNKQRNYAVVWSLLRVRDNIRKYTGISNYTIPKVKRLLAKLKIEPQKDIYTGRYIISFDEYNRVMNYVKEVMTQCDTR